ncbi:MAG TPA: hypothetical protein VEJ16_04520 [Alphaproteobacteria bacterium]|nr:hypothetical protein [Alphaproteobacteria bacterium]
MSHPKRREVEMTMFEGEPNLSEMLSDPIVLAVMKSDGVDRACVGKLLKKAAQAANASPHRDKPLKSARRPRKGA